MKNGAYEMAMLFDFYGDLLTERQREFFDLYYNDDLSLSEIAENYDITRQGVRDIILRAETALRDVEEKTGLVRRFHQNRAVLREIREIQSAMEARNAEGFQDAVLSSLTDRLSEAVKKLEEG